MRRTPRQDIDFIQGYIDKYPALSRFGGCRHFTAVDMSEELKNILSSIDAEVFLDVVSATDEIYLKALDILKMVIEEGE